MFVPQLHHVGIIVPTEEQAIKFMELLGLEEAYRGYVEQYKSLCIFTRGNGRSPVELVIPSGGVVKRFNDGIGGLHHVAFTVESLKTLAQQFKARGLQLLEPESVRGAGPFLCNFLHPAYTGGVTVEFIEELNRADSN